MKINKHINKITSVVLLTISSLTVLSSASLGIRQDFPETFIDLYKKERLPDVAHRNIYSYLRIFYIELIVSSSDVLEQLDRNGKIELLHVALRQVDDKKRANYDLFSQSSSALVLSKTLYAIGQTNPFKENIALQTFNETGLITNASVVDQIVSITNKYLDEYENF